MEKTLILPAEIMTRELDARILQGVIALDKGWQVILGSKTPITRALWKWPRSVYLCQALTHKRVKLLNYLTRMGHIIYGWDEEGLIYQLPSVYLARRVSSETLQHLDAVISWGQVSAAHLNDRAQTAGLKPIPIGNPRFDLLRPELRAIHQERVDELRDLYGDFILISSNFGRQNPIIPFSLEKLKSPKDDNSTYFLKDFAAHMDYRHRLFLAFQDMVVQLATKFKDRTIIIRPHPNEDHTSWQTLTKDIPNVHVIMQGSSIPWMIASKTIIHNNCTSAVEATIIGRVPIVYCPEPLHKNDSHLSNPISFPAHTFDELVSAVDAAFDGTLKPPKESKDILNQYIASIDGPLASERILDLCDELYQKMQNHKIKRLASGSTKLFCIFRQLKKKFRINQKKEKYTSHVFPHLETENLQNRANAIAQSLQLPFSVSVKLRGNNVFELTRT